MGRSNKIFFFVHLYNLVSITSLSSLKWATGANEFLRYLTLYRSFFKYYNFSRREGVKVLFLLLKTSIDFMISNTCTKGSRTSLLSVRFIWTLTLLWMSKLSRTSQATLDSELSVFALSDQSNWMQMSYSLDRLSTISLENLRDFGNAIH